MPQPNCYNGGALKMQQERRIAMSHSSTLAKMSKRVRAGLGQWVFLASLLAVCGGAFAVTLDAGTNAARFMRPMNLVNLGLLGILASAASYVLWNYACGVLGVVRTTIGIFLIPLFGVVFAVAFLGERLTGTTVNGGLVIIVGVVLANLASGRRT